LFGKHKNSAIFGARLLQILSLCLVITGFLWASSDMLMVTVLADSPVTPLSVLLMLYGSVGFMVSELLARWIAKTDNNDKTKKLEPDGSA
jgi:hypothetical protein